MRIQCGNTKSGKPDYDNVLYLHKLRELHQWEMELQGACMHHEEDSVNKTYIDKATFT